MGWTSHRGQRRRGIVLSRALVSGKKRLSQSKFLTILRDVLRGYLTQQLSRSLFARLACGRVEECLFDGEIMRVRETVYRILESEGEDPQKRSEENRWPVEDRLFRGCSVSRCRQYGPFTQEEENGAWPKKKILGCNWSTCVMRENCASAAEVEEAVQEQFQQSVRNEQATPAVRW